MCNSQIRNFLWLTPDLAQQLRTLKFLVVGCGGTGNLFSIFLASIGAKHVTVADSDRLEASNLNRFLPANLSCVGQSKVELTCDYIRSRFEGQFTPVQESFPSEQIRSLICESNYVVCCIDTIHSRIELDLYCRRMDKILVDIGTGFAMNESRTSVESGGGQVLVSKPKSACLMCMGFSDFWSNKNYFLANLETPEPSSLLLNSIVVGLALEQVLSDLTCPSETQSIRVAYDRASMSIKTELYDVSEACPICGPQGRQDIKEIL